MDGGLVFMASIPAASLLVLLIWVGLHANRAEAKAGRTTLGVHLMAWGVIAVLAVISITIIAVDLLGIGPVDIVRDGVNGALSPVRAVGNAVFGNHDSDEVAALRERIAELEGAEIEAANYQAELRRLQ